jgi:chromate transporter
MGPLGGLFGAALALVMIFLPGMLLMVAVLPHWNRFRRWDSAQALMRGANAAVVGILGAAIYQPVWTSAILGPREFALTLTGFLLGSHPCRRRRTHHHVAGIAIHTKQPLSR